jgi:hypothetical protein
MAVTARAAAAARPAQVVRRPNGRVVVILWGSDASYEAAEWVSKGYRVDSVSYDQLGL